jgi:HSP20 family molecular chaperone IbpA
LLSGQFRLEIDIEDFKPEELTVKTQDKRVLVCARRQVVQGNRASTRELSREHTIPDTVDPLTIKAFFTDTGKLIVEAPYVTR